METKKRLKLFIFLCFFICTFSVSFPLTIDKALSGEDNFVVINKLENGKPGVLDKGHHLTQRDIKAPVSNITAKVSQLNDSHQQIIVHWAGANSNVIVCLARSYTPDLNGKPPIPTAVYISYDYGATFTNQTHFFNLDTPDTYASIDKFVIHQKQIQFIVFIEKYNRVLYTSQNLGKTIKKVKLDFQLTDVLFYPEDPYVFLAYDVNRTLWVTRDFGNSFSMVQELVKTYYWAERWPGTWADTPTRSLLVQRIEPKGSTLLSLGNVIHSDQPNMTVRMHNIEQFKLLNDFMFVTKRLSPTNNELYISYRGSDFVKGTFDSELENGNFHVADAGEIRLMLAVAHTETLSNLYISEVTSSGSPYMFRLSLERLFTYFPNTMWKESWLSDVADETFADIHKVQGVKGIYLASQVQAGAKSENLNPEHLRTLVSFDWGGEWKPITPPAEDEFGRPITCNASTNCSLHLTQKFMYLYPFTRNIPIASSASAPGLIIATGVLGSSLKGHPGVFVSRDAGLSWHKVLQENYLFNFGDHGGVMTAVKYFKSSGETNELLYSTDEGITWRSYIFYPKKVRIYGLMTEPGGNTTVFTIFGSEVTQHEWIIINIDLKNAFAYNCNPDDYKMWSPSTGAANRKMSCVMGQRVVYERRIPHSNCYNGKDYQRQFSKETCECDIEDFECDFGFLRHVASPGCIRNKSETIDPYSIPPTCKPGQFYDRTKGYRKISGDLCTGGYEEQYLPEKLPCPFNETNQFLLVAQKNKVLRFDLTDPSKPEILPISGLGNVIAIDFDMKNNCVFYADIKKDLIGRQCLTSGKELPELLVMNDLSSIEGLAYDWISRYLYFVDGQRAKIEMIRTDINHSGRMRKTILNDTVLDKPRGITLHPKLGYLFYTDWSHDNPSVSRANLDGSNVKRLFTKPNVMWPNGITVDHIAETIYWVDAKLDYIASSDLHGRGFRKTLVHDERLVHPFSVAVFKDFMYWDDWFLNTIIMADKDHGAGIRFFAFNYTGLMDLKVYAHSLQEGTNRCQNGTAGVCSHLCFAQPDNNPPVCACPDAMIFSKGECLCADGTKPNANNTCPKIKQKCLDVQFSCHNNLCIPLTWKCDGMNDCGDSSDELFCHTEHCTGNSFRCNDGQCIPMYWVCDRDPDCRDKSDELNCPNVQCANNQFQCSDKRCISARWRCDGENDCRDASDERNCTNREPITCNDKQFSCPGNTSCIPNSWVCDGENDCLQGEDEKNCTVRKCESYQFKCEKSKRCIYSSWRCDGDADCGDGDTSDEENCNTTSTVIPTPVQPLFNVCKGFMFECKNKKCVPSWWKCDGVDDCSDNSDEEGCPSTTTTIQTTLPPSPLPPTSASCNQNEFMCKTGVCIRSAWLCDGERDCPGGEDETNCDKRSCPTGYIKCQFAPTCILAAHECDGIVQCPDGSDEVGCLPSEPEPVPVNPICSEGFFSCDGSKCLPLAKFCDDHRDCYDEYDETNCNDHPDRVYQVLQISVDKRRKNATSIPLQWWIQTPAGVKFEFLPSRAEVADGKQIWKNQTKWTSNIDSMLTDLYPATQYNITVYVRIAGRARAYPPAVFVTATTGEAPPSPPWNVTVIQKSLEEVEVRWSPPRHPNGVLTCYTVYSSPPLPPSTANAPPSKTSLLFPGRFIQGSRYSFWVVAVNQAGESNSSDVKTVVSESDAGVGPLLMLKGLEIGESSVLLAWEPVPGAEGYKVVPATQPPYPALNTIRVNTSKCSVKNLAPGVQYKFSVNAYSKSYDGPKSTISIRTKGEELPKVEGLEVQLLKDFATSVKLSWHAPKSAKNLKWKYQIYYGTTAEELYKNGKLETSNTSATVHGLEACQKYLFDVGLSGPLGHGPLTGLSTMEITRYSLKAPVKQLRLSMDPHNETLLLIRWSSSCPQMAQPIGYIIYVQELGNVNNVVGKKGSVTLLPTNKTELEHRVFVHYGAKYRVEIETTAEGAVMSTAEEHWAPTLPTPHQIQVQAHPYNYSFQIFWQLSTDLPNMPSVDYEVLVNEGMVLNASSAAVIRSKSSPVWVGEVKEGTPYTMAVRLVSEYGFASPLSEITSVLLPVGSAMAVVSTTSLLSVVVPACALLLALLVGLAMYAVKHYRLRNSFSSFANSHYSTSSGAAVFTDRLDDEDSPVIRGFSDDEPLVVA